MSKERRSVSIGERIAQIVFIRLPKIENLNSSSDDDVGQIEGEDIRGDKGFGSTNI